MPFDLYPKCNGKKLKGFKKEYYRLLFSVSKDYSKSFLENGLKGTKVDVKRLDKKCASVTKV